MLTYKKIKMRIAVIVNVFPSISETFILNEIKGLIDLGHEIDIFANRKTNGDKFHFDIKDRGLIKRITYFAIPEARISRAIKALKIILRYFVFFHQEIIKCLRYKESRGKYFALNNLFFLQYFLGNKYDVIHCQFGSKGKDLIFLKDIINTKIITTFRGYDLSSFLKKNEDLYKDLFLKGDLFLCVSNYFKNRLVNLNCPKEKILVHYSGIDSKKFSFNKRVFENKNNINILSVGRLTEKKGLKYAILAINKVIAKYKNIHYIIIGDGLLRDELEGLVDKLKLRNNVEFLGCLFHEEVFKYYERSNIFILPCITADNGDQEGIPNVIKEAMSTGMPVISTYHAGVPELVIDGYSGLLVPEKDVDALAEKLEYLIEHPEICHRMGLAGREFIEHNFEISNLNKELSKLYENLLTSKKY